MIKTLLRDDNDDIIGLSPASGGRHCFSGCSAREGDVMADQTRVLMAVTTAPSILIPGGAAVKCLRDHDKQKKERKKKDEAEQ